MSPEGQITPAWEPLLGAGSISLLLGVWTQAVLIAGRQSVKDRRKAVHQYLLLGKKTNQKKKKSKKEKPFFLVKETVPSPSRRQMWEGRGRDSTSQDPPGVLPLRKFPTSGLRSHLVSRIVNFWINWENDSGWQESDLFLSLFCNWTNELYALRQAISTLCNGLCRVWEQSRWVLRFLPAISRKACEHHKCG